MYFLKFFGSYGGGLKRAGALWEDPKHPFIDMTSPMQTHIPDFGDPWPLAQVKSSPVKPRGWTSDLCGPFPQ